MLALDMHGTNRLVVTNPEPKDINCCSVICERRSEGSLVHLFLFIYLNRTDEGRTENIRKSEFPRHAKKTKKKNKSEKWWA